MGNLTIPKGNPNGIHRLESLCHAARKGVGRAHVGQTTSDVRPAPMKRPVKGVVELLLYFLGCWVLAFGCGRR